MEQVLIQLVLMIVKETLAKIQGGNNKTVVWSTALPISDLIGKGEQILGLPCQINQISNSSRPNNCSLYSMNSRLIGLLVELRTASRHGTIIIVTHSCKLTTFCYV